METSENLAEYLRLEKLMIAADDHSEEIREQMDPVWYKLTDDERESLKGSVQSETSENLKKYLELEKQMNVADKHAEDIRRQMYPVSDKLTVEECRFLNSRKSRNFPPERIEQMRQELDGPPPKVGGE